MSDELTNVSLLGGALDEVEAEEGWNQVRILILGGDALAQAYFGLHNITLMSGTFAEGLRPFGILAAIGADVYAFFALYLATSSSVFGKLRSRILFTYAALMFALVANTIVDSQKNLNVLSNNYLVMYQDWLAPIILFVILVVGSYMILLAHPLVELRQAFLAQRELEHKGNLAQIKARSIALRRAMRDPVHNDTFLSRAVGTVQAMVGASRNGEHPEPAPTPPGRTPKN